MNNEYAKKNADPECFDCGGTGLVTQYVQPDDRHETYCICVIDAKNQRDAEPTQDHE